MPLFGKSQKSPAEVVKALKEAVTSLEKGDKKLEKVWYFIVYQLLLALSNFLTKIGSGRCQQELGPYKEYAVRHLRQ